MPNSNPTFPAGRSWGPHLGASWSIESFFSSSVEPFFSFRAFLQDTLSGSLLFRLALGSVASLLPLQTMLPFLFSSYDFYWLLSCREMSNAVQLPHLSTTYLWWRVYEFQRLGCTSKLWTSRNYKSLHACVFVDRATNGPFKVVCATKLSSEWWRNLHVS